MGGSQRLSLIWHPLTDVATVHFRKPVSRNVPTIMELVENTVWIGRRCFLFRSLDVDVLKPAVPAAYVLCWPQRCQTAKYADKTYLNYS